MADNWIKGADLIPVPMTYLSEFVRDPTDSLIKYGSLPQRARSPWFTDLTKMRACLCLKSMVGGQTGVKRSFPQRPDDWWFAGEAHPVDHRLLGSVDIEAMSWRQDWNAPWHVHVDPGLMRGRKGDAAGLALGRIVDSVSMPIGNEYRTVNRYIVPLVMQVIAPEYGEIHLTAITTFILQLRGMLKINVTSFSYDGFQSAGAIQELTQAGMVTNGVRVDEYGRLDGFGKPYSVDRSGNAHQELKEAVNEERVLMPDYPPLTHELSHLEDIPGKAPDHPVGGSKDLADACAGVVGYLSEFGHAVFVPPSQTTVSAFDIPGFGTQQDEAPGFVID